jgi:hypothetical protein
MNQITSLAIAFVVTITLSSLTAQTFAQEKIRNWRSHDGGESIRASFVKFDKETDIVSLQDESGEQIEVEITLLSRADRRYVAKEFKKSSKAKHLESVFKKNDASEATLPATVNLKSDRDPSRTFRRYGINWTEGIDKAIAKASERGKQRPLMWFRVLGDLNGLM